MRMILKKASRNFLYRHPWQLCLAILGITLGVAVVVAIDLTLDSSLQTFTRTTQALSGKATHRIVASDGGLDEKLYTTLRVELGMSDISPVINGYIKASATENTFKLYGIDPMIESTFQSSWQKQDKESGAGLRLMTEVNTVLMSQQAAEKMGLQLEDQFRVITDVGAYDLKIIAWIPEKNAVTKELLENLLITDISTAQEVLGLVGKLSAIDVLIAPEQEDKKWLLDKKLPPDVLLVSLDNQAESLQQMTHAFAINLNAMGLLSLLVGMFLIYNTMTFLVIQRRGLFGSLRSIGVTRQQIFQLIISEAMFLAVIGTMIGIVLGIILGQGLLQIISGTINVFYFSVDQSILILSPVLISKGIFLGIGATLIAVLGPAWEATRLSPQHTLQRSRLESDVRSLMRTVALVALLFILGSLAVILVSETNISLGLVSIFFLLFGCALLTPIVTLLLMNLLERVLGRYSSIVAKLPVRMVKAEISRTGIAIATLMIAVAVSIGMDIMIGSFRLTVSEWLQTSLQADLYVNLAGNTQAADKAEMDRHLKTRLAGLEGVEALSSVLHTQLYRAQVLTKVSIFELNAQSKRGFIFKQSGVDTWDDFSQKNSIFVTEPYAYHHKTQLGDKILLRTDKGDQSFTVLAIYTDYSGDQGHLAMSRSNYEKYWPDLGYSGIGIYVESEADSQQVEKQVKQLLKPYQSVRSEQAIFQASMQMFEQTFKITEILRLLAASIAFVGVFSALMALQFERTQQMGILRSIGMTPMQIGRIISTETGLMGLIAGLFAVPVGFIMAYVLIFVVYQRSFGWTMAFHFDVFVIVQAILLALLAALFAGVLPAIKMAQTKPAEALRSE